MNEEYKPEGYTSVAPYIIAAGTQRVIDFLKATFDATWRRALAAGGEPVQELTRKDDPDRRGGIKDPSGNTWWIATQVG